MTSWTRVDTLLCAVALILFSIFAAQMLAQDHCVFTSDPWCLVNPGAKAVAHLPAGIELGLIMPQAGFPCAAWKGVMIPVPPSGCAQYDADGQPIPWGYLIPLRSSDARVKWFHLRAMVTPTTGQPEVLEATATAYPPGQWSSAFLRVPAGAKIGDVAVQAFADPLLAPSKGGGLLPDLP